MVQTIYDIVKAHSGTITVESLPASDAGPENSGTEFIIRLPVN